MKSITSNAVWQSAVFEQGGGENDWNKFSAVITISPNSIDSPQSNSEILLSVFNTNETDTFIFETSDDEVNEKTIDNFTLSTPANSAWCNIDSSSSTLETTANLSIIVGETITPRGMHLSGDGKYLFITHSDKIKRLEFGTPFDFSTLTYNNNGLDTAGGTINGIAISPNGRYLIYTESGFTVNRRILETPFDLSTSTAIDQTQTVPKPSFGPESVSGGIYGGNIRISPDGNYLFFAFVSRRSATGTNAYVYSYTYTIDSWDLTDFTLFADHSFSSQFNGGYGTDAYEDRVESITLSMSSDARHFILSTVNLVTEEDVLYQYQTNQFDLNSPASGMITTAQFPRTGYLFFDGGYAVTNSSGTHVFNNVETKNYFEYDISNLNLQSNVVNVYEKPLLTFSQRVGNAEFVVDTLQGEYLLEGDSSNTSDMTITLPFNNSIYPAFANGGTLSEYLSFDDSVSNYPSNTSSYDGFYTSAVDLPVSGTFNKFSVGAQLVDGFYSVRASASNTSNSWITYLSEFDGDNTGTVHGTTYSTSGNPRFTFITYSDPFDISSGFSNYATNDIREISFDVSVSINPIWGDSIGNLPTAILNSNTTLFRKFGQSNSKIIAVNNTTLYQYDLVSNNNLETANTSTVQTFSLGEIAGGTPVISEDGKRMILQKASGFLQLDMTESWNVATASITKSFTFNSSQVPAPSSYGYYYIPNANQSFVIATDLSRLGMYVYGRTFDDRFYTITEVSGTNNEILTVDSNGNAPDSALYIKLSTPVTAVGEENKDYTSSNFEYYQKFNDLLQMEIDVTDLASQGRFAQFKLEADEIDIDVNTFYVQLEKVS